MIAFVRWAVSIRRAQVIWSWIALKVFGTIALQDRRGSRRCFRHRRCWDQNLRSSIPCIRRGARAADRQWLRGLRHNLADRRRLREDTARSLAAKHYPVTSSIKPWCTSELLDGLLRVVTARLSKPSWRKIGRAPRRFFATTIIHGGSAC
jgi:hypothetical protein